MEDLLSVDRLLAVWNVVFGWLRTNVFVLDTAIQAGVIALTLLLAVLLSNRAKVWLARYREHRHVGRGVVILESLTFAITWFGLVWVADRFRGFSDEAQRQEHQAETDPGPADILR